jgi:hypothetical protein
MKVGLITSATLADDAAEGGIEDNFVAPPSGFTLYCIATKIFGFQLGVPTTRCF